MQAEIVELAAEPRLLESCVRTVDGAMRAKPYALSNMSDLQVQQALIVKDLLFALLGHEGFYIRFSEKYDPASVDAVIRGPDFKIARHLDVSLKTVTKKIIRFGKFYWCISKFIEIYDHSRFGKVVQRLCFSLIEFKARYEAVVLSLEHQFAHNPAFNLSAMENTLNHEIATPMNHLYELVNAIHAETAERSKNVGSEVYFSQFIRTIQNDLKQTGSIDLSADLVSFGVCKGGVALRVIQSRLELFKGDAVSTRFLVDLFEAVSQDYKDMLNSWLMAGEIDDPFEEFLIKKNRVPPNLSKFMNIHSEKYWDELYMIRTDGTLDQFSAKDIQQKILCTGKYLNIFKYCTGLENFDALNESLSPIASLFAQDFELKVNFYYNRANKLLMKLLFSGFKFSSVFTHISSVFLLNDSYSIDSFIDTNFSDFQKNKYKSSTSKLIKSFQDTLRGDGDVGVINSTIDFTIDSSNFFELAREILNVKSFDADLAMKNDANTFKEILNKSLQRSAASEAGSSQYDPDHLDEYTISGANLEINLPFPLNFVVGQSFVFEFQLVFKLQIIVKFLNKLIDNSWKEINLTTVWKYDKFKGNIGKWILRSRILHNRMRDFMNEFQYYLNFDVVDANLSELKQYLQSIDESLAHETLETQSDISQPNDSFDLQRGLNPVGHYNDIFTDSVFKAKKKLQKEDLVNVENLTNRIGSFLNSILRDSLITNSVLVDTLKRMLDLILSYNHFLLRLKKSIIMMNEELFNEFSSAYPSKFNDKRIDEASMQARFNNLNEMVNYHFEVFNNGLSEFLAAIKSVGDLESPQLLVLVEKLESCFPDH